MNVSFSEEDLPEGNAALEQEVRQDIGRRRNRLWLVAVSMLVAALLLMWFAQFLRQQHAKEEEKTNKTSSVKRFLPNSRFVSVTGPHC